MKSLYLEMSDVWLGLWHSLRGFYRWYFYDQPENCTTIAVAVDAGLENAIGTSPSSQVGQPLTSLGRRTWDSKGQEKVVSHELSKKSTLRNVLNITMTYNSMLAGFNLFCSVVDLVTLRLIDPGYYGWSNFVSWFIFVPNFVSRVFFCKLINIMLQNQIAEQVYQQAVGRARDLEYAVLGSDLYASLHLQFVYYGLLSVVRSCLSWLGPAGDLITVFLSTPYWSLYTFDYCWYYMGVPFNNRLTCIEKHWPYFAGFGLLMAIIDVMFHPFFSSILPIFLLPLFIISATEASAQLPKEPCSRFSIHFFYFPVMVSNKIHVSMETACYTLRSVINWFHSSKRTASPPPSESSTSRPSTPSPRDVSHSSASRRSVTPERRSSAATFPSPCHQPWGQSSRPFHLAPSPGLDRLGHFGNVAMSTGVEPFAAPLLGSSVSGSSSSVGVTPSQILVASWLQNTVAHSAGSGGSRFNNHGNLEPASSRYSENSSTVKRPPTSQTSASGTPGPTSAAYKRNYGCAHTNDIY